MTPLTLVPGKVTFNITGMIPNNHVGTIVIFIEYQGVVGNPSGKLAVNLTTLVVILQRAMAMVK